MPHQLTIRGVSDELDQRLKTLAQARGESKNATVLEILRSALGIEERRRRLARYADWTAQDQEMFEASLRDQRRIDDELWR